MEIQISQQQLMAEVGAMAIELRLNAQYIARLERANEGLQNELSELKAEKESEEVPEG